MTPQHGELVLVAMTFHEGEGSKVRPAVEVLDSGDDDFVCALITSQVRDAEHDLVLREWNVGGLNRPSVARLHKVTVLPKTDILRRIGRLSASDRESLVEILCRAYCRRTV